MAERASLEVSAALTEVRLPARAARKQRLVAEKLPGGLPVGEAAKTAKQWTTQRAVTSET
jgi:hypothetical protein